MRRVLHLMRKELLELRQDPRLFGVVILAPIIQLTVLGYAATTDVKDVPMVVVDADRSTASRDLIDAVRRVGQLHDRGMRRIDRARSIVALDRGEAWMALSIPPDYGQRSAREASRRRSGGRTAPTRTRPTSRWAMRSALSPATRRSCCRRGGPPAPAGPRQAEIRVWFNPGSRAATS